jgi:hypothetical protein
MPAAVDTPSPATEVVLLSWKVHRLREEPRHLRLVAVAYGAAIALWWLLFPQPLALFLPAVSLTSALAEYLLPITYRLTNRGAYVSNGFSRLFLSWQDVKRATAGAEGIYLSPLARAGSPLEPFRGVRLRFAAGNAEAVTETVRGLWRGAGRAA